MSTEIVDYYDLDGKVVSAVSREEAEALNYTTPNAIVFVFTPDRKVILQKRSLNKKHYPGLWDVSACGGISHGEDPLEAAKRELYEEIGIDCTLHFVEKFMNHFPDESGTLTRCRYSHLYVGVAAPDTAHNHEVETVGVFELRRLIKAAAAHPEEYVPSFALELDKCVLFYQEHLLSD